MRMMLFSHCTVSGNRHQATLVMIVLACLTVCTPPVRGAERSVVERAFRAQILVELDAQAALSPSSGQHTEWATPPRWNVNHKVATVFVLVQISPPLIHAAVEYWADSHPNASPARKKAAATKLQNQYLRRNERAFLLLVKLVETGAYHDEWGIRIGPIPDNVQLVNLDGSAGKVTRVEKTIDRMLDGTCGIKACLFWVSDNVGELDPTFNIRLSSVYYFIKHSGYLSKTRDWVQARSPETVFFRFETGEVNILRMIEDGVPWAEIDEKYVQTELRFAAASSYDGVAKFVADIAVDLIVGLLLKPI